MKVAQPNDDGDLGMSPTYKPAATNGIYNEPNWYRFYMYRNQSSGPYLLYAQWSKNGVVNGLDVTGNLVVNGAVHLRMRMDNSSIHFEASLDGQTWLDAYNETFALPGYTLDNTFYYELSAARTSVKGVMTVDDFSITSSTGALTKSSETEHVAESMHALPTAFALSHGFPNPFSHSEGRATQLRVELPETGQVQAVVYNLTGQEVQRLAAGHFAAGQHALHWDGTNGLGQSVHSGVYLVRVTFAAANGNRQSLTRQVVLVK